MKSFLDPPSHRINRSRWKHALFSSAFPALLFRFSLICSFLLILLACVGRVFFSSANGWSDMWLAPTFYFWNGYDIYGANGKPGWAILYGPIMYLAYSPAILGSTPSSAIRIASSLSIFYGTVAVLAPVWVLTRHSFFTRRTLAWGTAVVLMTVAWINPSLSNLFHIRPETPATVALVLAALAVAFPFRGSLWLAAGLCCVASSSKFVYLTAAGGLFCYLYQTEGRKQALNFVICMMATGIVALALIHWKFGLAEVYEATIRNASAHPFAWRKTLNSIKTLENSSLLIKLACSGRAFQLLIFHLLPFFLLMALLWISTPDKKNHAGSAGHRWLLLCGWMALALLPTSILGFAKFGGDFNTLAPMILFLLQAGLVLSINWYQHDVRPKIIQGVMILGLAVSCSYLAIQSAIAFYRSDNAVYTHLEKLLKKYPDEVWLPSRPLAHWFFQKKAVHSGDVLFCLRLGNTELPSSWLAAGWPEKMTFVVQHHYDPNLFVKNITNLMKHHGDVMAESKDPEDFDLPKNGSYIVLGPPSVEENSLAPEEEKLPEPMP